MDAVHDEDVIKIWSAIGTRMPIAGESCDGSRQGRLGLDLVWLQLRERDSIQTNRQVDLIVTGDVSAVQVSLTTQALPVA